MLVSTPQADDRNRARRQRRWALTGVGAAALIAGLGMIGTRLAQNAPRIRPDGLDDQALRVQVAALALPMRRADNAAAQPLAVLGARLFQDAGLGHDGSGAGRSCATCHDPARQFTDGRPLAVSGRRQTPGLTRLPPVGPYGWAGDHDGDLAAFLEHHLEDPDALGTSRVALLRAVTGGHAAAWQAAGLAALRTPPADVGHARPPAEGPGFQPPFPVLVTAMASMGNSDLLIDILKAAQTARHAPIYELATRAFPVPVVAPEWTAAWEALTPDVRADATVALGQAARALAAVVETFARRDSPFDRFARRIEAGADLAAALDTRFGEHELRGLRLFLGPLGCARCHAGGDFTDDRFHNIGLPQSGAVIDLGRAAAMRPSVGPDMACATAPEASPAATPPPCLAETKAIEAALGAFRTPSLRNVALTPPYMHDGQLATLDEVLDHYDLPTPRPAVGRRDDQLHKDLNLTGEERHSLLAFLASLTSAQATGETTAAAAGTQDAARRH